MREMFFSGGGMVVDYQTAKSGSLDSGSVQAVHTGTAGESDNVVSNLRIKFSVTGARIRIFFKFLW